MSKFKIVKTIKLDFLGEEYNESYLKFNSIAMSELSALQEKLSGFDPNSTGAGLESIKIISEELGSRFVSGKVAVDGKLVDVSKDDLLDLPVDAIDTVVERLTGKVDPN